MNAKRRFFYSDKRDKFFILFLIGGDIFNVHICREYPYCSKANDWNHIIIDIDVKWREHTEKNYCFY